MHSTVNTRPCPNCGATLKLSNHHTYHCHNEDCSVHKVRYNRQGQVTYIVYASEPLASMLVHPRREAFW